MKIFKPPYWENPSETEGKTIFLAGSIEMGKASRWDQKIEKALKSKEVTLFNPRRDNWDSSWEQSIENENFRGQVMWELDHIEKSNIVVFFLEGDTKSPISLAELGLVCGLKVSGKVKNIIVCCEDEFWRKGNVEVLCYKYDIPLYAELDELIEQLKKLL